LKIVDIKTEVKKLALKTPFITALRRVEDIEFVRVSFICESGKIGLGEAPATKAVTGEGIDDILYSIQSVKGYLNFHMPTDALELLHEVRENDHAICSIGNSARAALDMALISLIAQQQNIPIYEYLGAQNISTLKTDVTISLKNPHAMLEDAKLAYSNGLDILKIKLGEDINHAKEVTKAIRDELPHSKIIIDANQAWHVQNCIRFIDEVKNCNIELIEQPVIAKDLDGLKTVTKYSTIPILADESVFTLEDAQNIINTKSADMINIKLMKCGGIIKAIEILEYCRSQGVNCMLGSMLEGPISINIALHLAMAYKEIIKYIDLDSPLLYKEMSNELEFKFNANEISFNV
jgi:L-alanine-DL-glutamate epimerase-like enolase superfamily enzyme